MANSGGSEKPKAEGPPEGVSAFIAKVLDQLSLTSWLPAAVFASGLVVLTQLRRQGSLSITDALTSISSDYQQVLILTIPVLILATIFTQAFSWAAIRILEGYWWRRGPSTVLRNLMIRRHVRRRNRLYERRKEAARKAFNAIRGDLLDIYTCAVVCALERQALEKDVPDLPSPEEQRTYDVLHWRTKCHAWDLARVEQFEKQRADYPIKPSRILPTKLGNVLRSTEDRLKFAGSDLEGFVMRRRGKVSERIQIQHDQFRDRLDMYCTMVFVSAALAIVTVALLATIPVATWKVLCLAAGFLVFAFACYGSAIASARGYGAVLRQMDLDEGSASISASAP